MNTIRILLAFMVFAVPVHAQDSFHSITDEVNYKLVKVFGAGGYPGVPPYGTGVVVSEDGYILTVASLMLNTSDLRVHLSDGRRYQAEVVVVEPALDMALLKIKTEDDFLLSLDYFDVAEASQRPTAEPGTWIVGFSNLFEIATRDEPLTVQRGVIAAVTELSGRRGIFEAPYSGPVYVIDAITNNPGAGGGVITTRDGQLLGIIGKELKNSLTDTWINYAVPINASVQVEEEGMQLTVSLPDFVDRGMAGTYKPTKGEDRQPQGKGGYLGVVFVPDVVERTPPYVEKVVPGSPAEKAGFQPDDLIVFLDGEPVYSIKSFRQMIALTRPGMDVQFEVRRGDRLETIPVTLDTHPDN